MKVVRTYIGEKPIYPSEVEIINKGNSEYTVFDGTQYFICSFDLNPHDTVQIQAQFNVRANGGIIGYRRQQGRGQGAYLDYNAGQFRVGINDHALYSILLTDYDYGAYREGIWNFSLNPGLIVLNGINYPVDYTPEDKWVEDQYIQKYVIGTTRTNIDGSLSSSNFQGKIWYVRVYNENQVLIHNIVPYGWETPYMQDTVTGEIYDLNTHTLKA